MTNERDVQDTIRRLRRRSNAQLLLALSRKSAALYHQRHYVGTIHASTDNFAYAPKKSKTYYLSFSRLDRPMLDSLGDALRGNPSVENGELIVKKLWPRVRQKLCAELHICERFKPSDASLILAIWAALHRGQPTSDRDAYLVVAILAFRFGPEWMCKCSERQHA